MATFIVTQEALFENQETWRGRIEYKEIEFEYYYQEDINGQELGVHSLDADEWQLAVGEVYDMLYAACQEWGDPSSFGPIGEVCEIDDDIIQEYK